MSKMLLVFSSVLQFSSFSSCASTSLFSQAGLIHFVVLTTVFCFSFWLPRRCFGCCVLICASHTRESGESEVEKKLIPFFCRNPQDLHILESKSLDSFFYIQTSRKHFLVIVVIAHYVWWEIILNDLPLLAACHSTSMWSNRWITNALKDMNMKRGNFIVSINMIWHPRSKVMDMQKSNLIWAVFFHQICVNYAKNFANSKPL